MDVATLRDEVPELDPFFENMTEHSRGLVENHIETNRSIALNHVEIVENEHQFRHTAQIVFDDDGGVDVTISETPL